MLLAWDKKKICNSVENRELYNRIRACYRADLISAKKEYNARLISESDNSCKAAWAVINNECPRKRTKGDFATADEFNSYFIESVLSIVNDLPTPEKCPDEFLENVPCQTQFVFQPISDCDVLKIVHSFKNSKSKDVYDLSPWFLKKVIHIISVPLACLINNCLASGVFPDSLKISRTVPVFKKGDKEVVSSFRPISLIPVIAKVFETVMRDQLYKYFECNGLLTPSQFGFRQGLSAPQAVESVYNIITNGFENKEATSMVLVDIARAFDCVPHAILLKKLAHYGVAGQSLEVFTSYLSNRNQVVCWNGESSQMRKVSFGVPQGSVLGPLLFLIMINDIAYNLSGRVLLFADDTSLLATHENIVTAKELASNLLTECEKWFCANHLSLNQTKTQIMTFNLSNYVDLAKGKLLGFDLDPKLSWSWHIDSVCKKLSRVTYLLRKLQYSVPEAFWRVAYLAFFEPHIRYGLKLWGHAANVSDVLLLQKRAIRVICRVGPREHCKPLFVELALMTVYSLYVLECLMHVKINFDCFVMRGHIHYHSTRTREHLDLPRTRLSKIQKSYLHVGLKMYNSLPVALKSMSVSKFKACVKKNLLLNPLYSVHEFFDVCHTFC
jgi:hypothetical protein